MNRWIRSAVVSASMASALTLFPFGVASAQQPSTSQPTHDQGRHGFGPHHPRLLGEALKLDSLTTDQRTSIEALVHERRAATVPVRAADGQVLTVLAQQVEQAAIDGKALAPALGAEENAATAASAVERDALDRLHGLLTPAQRGEVVDRLFADRGSRHGHEPDSGAPGAQHDHEHVREPALAGLGLSADQKAQIAANLRAGAASRMDGGLRRERGERRRALEAFRGDSFDASGVARVEKRGERAERLAEATVPVLNPAQRALLASALRKQAARESHG
jgi:Spy/CpxP family protein refolding chaperone